jgi:hypothetical protein
MNLKLERANYLEKEIKKLKYTLNHIIVDTDLNNTDRSPINIILNKKISYSLELKRSFSIGEHKETLEISNQMVSELRELLTKKILELENELESIL